MLSHGALINHELLRPVVAAVRRRHRARLALAQLRQRRLLRGELRLELAELLVW